MATVAPPADQATDLLQKLSLDSQTKTLEIPEPNKKNSVGPGEVTNGQIQSYDRSFTPLLNDMDPNLCYGPNNYPYYYGGYDGTTNEWDEYPRFVNQDGVEMPVGIYGENAPYMYHHGYGYAPYGPYSPAASPVPMGHDGQLYGAQYQYPVPYVQPYTPTNGSYPSAGVPPKGELPTSAAADQTTPLSLENVGGNQKNISNVGGVKGTNGSATARPPYQNSLFNGSYGKGGLPGGITPSGYQDPRFSYDGSRSPISWLDSPMFSDGQPKPVTNTTMASSISSGNGVPTSRNHNIRPHSHYMGLHHPTPMSGINPGSGYVSRIFPNKLYGQYGNSYRSGVGFGSNVYDSRANGRGWLAVDSKYKPRGRNNGYLSYGNENMDGLNELNRGPRAKSTSKNQKVFSPVSLAVKGQNIQSAGTNDIEKEKLSVTPDREQYNKADFPVSYSDARFFIIKSYSEDDVHKSIKYNVWASTPNGNKKLDAAYQEAQTKSVGCPIFLFFSVNTSGQFVGVAEMVGPVDFNKNVEYWQQDKWIGCFPVKWHIVKDVPNILLKHITLENNENKPVTNSRDTQEVKLDQGLQVLKIFKDHSSKQCILDDFDFYEDRQKRILEKKAKQQQFQKQVWEGKVAEEKKKEGMNVEIKILKPSEVASESPNESTTHVVQANGDAKKPLENGLVLKSGDGLKEAQPTAENKIVANGTANGC